jgi:multidrug resistance protein MdtO
MSSGGFLPPGLVNPVRFLREELAPYPGRLNLALRVMLSSAVILVASLTLEVPFVGLSLIIALVIAQMNVVVSRLAGVLIILGITLGCTVTILLYKFTYDYPLLRILTTVALLYGCLYLYRAATLLGPAFWLAAIIVSFAQTFVDQTDIAEILVRGILWVWVSFCYPVVVGLVVNTLLLPLEPKVQLNAEFHRQLQAIDARLAWLLGDREEPSEPITLPVVQKGALALQKLLKFTTMRDKRVKSEQARYLATIATVSRLYDAASDLPAEPVSAEPELVDAPRQLRSAVAELDAAIAGERAFVLPEPSSSMRRDIAIEPIVEMQDALQALSEFEKNPSPAAAAGEMPPMLVPDAFTNPVYNQFALKTLLAVMISYLFYTGADYGGSHTIMLTCIIIAQSSAGAVMRKAWLRFFGAGIASLIALFHMVFVIPQIDSLVGVLMMVLPVMAVSSWIMAGSERIAYVGFQMTVTYGLAFMMNFGPSTDLTEVRDRMIGVLLGIVVYTVVSTLLWPEREGKSARDALADLVKEIGKFLRPIRQQVATGASTAVAQQHLTVMTKLGESEDVLARVALEPRGRESEQAELTLTLQTILAQARSLAVAANDLQRQIEVHQNDLPAEVREAVESVQEQIIAALDTYTEGLRGDGCRSPEPIPLDKLERSFPSSSGAASEKMKSAILDATENVVRQLSNLPGWSASLPSPTEVELIPSYG